MQNEFELTFINVNEDKLRESLQGFGVKKLQDKKLMRRQTLDFSEGAVPEGERKWAHVRVEGDKVTMTIKHIIDKSKIDRIKEVETTITGMQITQKYIC